MDNGKRPKVVFCASEADVAQIARALRAGADEYILKPFDRSAVEAKLHEVGML
jgi:two-component system chemotaxis response regulator CheY